MKQALASGTFAVLAFHPLTDMIQNSMTYYPVREIRQTPKDFGATYEEVTVKAEDGEKIHGWFHAVPDTKRTILYFHGNGGNLSGWASFFATLSTLQVNLYFIDYRGYGQSTGKPREKGLYQDARAAYQHLIEVRKILPEEIVVFGSSLGSAVAMQLVTQVPVARLIVEAPFTGTVPMAKFHYPKLPLLDALVNNRFHSLARAPEIRIPKLWIHGTEDNIVPFSMGEEIFAAFPEPKESYVIPGASHNDLFGRDPETYLARIRKFILSERVPQPVVAP